MTRTARYWSVGGDVGQPGECWVVLHGYQQLARRFLRRFEPVAGDHRRVVAPEGLSRFYSDPRPGRHGRTSPVGASWMTREDREHEIRDYVAYLDRLWDHLRQDLPGSVRLSNLSIEINPSMSSTIGRRLAVRACDQKRERGDADEVEVDSGAHVLGKPPQGVRWGHRCHHRTPPADSSLHGHRR